MAFRMANGLYTKKLIRIPQDLLDELEEESEKDDRSVNGLLIHALREWLKDKRQDRPRRQPAAAGD
jgi:hypothetical protein